jgi:long-chain acyl-CoA synthetase
VKLPLAHRSSPPVGRSVIGETVLDVFRDDVQLLADRPALRYREGDAWRVVTWAEYGELAAEVMAGFVALGIEPGDRLAILSGNRVEWHAADVAALAAGAVTVPVYPTSAASQVSYVLGHSGTKVCVVENVDALAKVLLHRAELPDLTHLVVLDPPEGFDDPSLLSFTALRRLGQSRLADDPELFDRRSRGVARRDLATLVYTSGTTGPPKGAMITHGNVMDTIRAITTLIPITPDDRFLSFLPLSHIAERVVSHIGQIVSGGETWFARSLATVPEDLQACRPTIFFAVPRVWEKFHEAISEKLAQESGITRRIAARYFELGERTVAHEQDGAPMSLSERIAYGALDGLVGRKIRGEVGLDRARLVVSAAAPIHPTLLRWFAGVGLRIAEVYGQTEGCGPTTITPPDAIKFGKVGPPMPGVEVRIAEDGEILVRGGNVCAGYYKRPEATAELLDADGWMHSGDLGVLDPDGYLRITGRKKDLIINAAGKNISPQEIETRLRMEPLISQAVVVGDGRPYLVALLTLDAEALAEWASEHAKSMIGRAELMDDPDLRDEIGRSVERVNAEHARVEGIKRWAILPGEFTIADGELTPTLKVRRAAVADKHADLIDELYAAP